MGFRGCEGLNVTKQDKVLNAWAEQDDWGKRTEVREYVFADQEGGDVLEKLSRLLGSGRYAFTREWGMNLRQGEAPRGLATAYVDEFPADGFELRRVDGGGQVRLVLPKDEGVFHCTTEIGGRSVVSDVQLYLDLLSAGEIGSEQALNCGNDLFPEYRIF